MTNEQALREALQAVIAAHDAEMKELGERMHAANLKTLRVDIQAAIDMFSAIEQARQALALPTALAISDTWGISRALVTLYAYECDGATDKALALPTADHIPEVGQMVADHLPEAGKMIETAAPVGERDLAPVIAYRLDYPASEGVGLPRFFGADDGERAHTFAFNHKATITELCDRAALSAGDAADAQRTPLTVVQYNAIPELCAIPPSLYESVERAIERAHGIDAAKRKAKT